MEDDVAHLIGKYPTTFGGEGDKVRSAEVLVVREEAAAELVRGDAGAAKSAVAWFAVRCHGAAIVAFARMKRVVIVGRPNVGKSTLFNRLAGKRRALTHDLPGMTRDRLSDVVELDDGRRYELTDTGGMEYGESPMSAYAPEIKA